jgi:jasmonate ZIM domain-containing protein
MPSMAAPLELDFLGLRPAAAAADHHHHGSTTGGTTTTTSSSIRGLDHIAA